MNTDVNATDPAYFVRLALPLMLQLNVPVTPMNYTVWYAYVSGQNQELSLEIDRIREKSLPFTNELNESLYLRYCAPRDSSALKELREDIREVLVTVFQGLKELGGQSELYGTALDRQVQRLSEERPVQEIRTIIREIVAETRKMADIGKKMQAKLKKASQELEALQEALDQAKSESLVDFLTGVANRKAFDIHLKELVQEAVAEKEPLCLLMIDIDHFKVFNDTFGHLVGDEVLKYVAEKIRSIVRGRDFFARIGGEEFAVILPKTPLGGARVVAENICSLLNRKALKIAGSQQSLGRVTVSIGLASYQPGEMLNQLVERSDRALYLAKRNGRNCFATEEEMATDPLPLT